MRSYGQYCPVARAAEVLGDRWTMLVVRDLVEGVHRFSDLSQGLPGMSRTLLTQRLRSLGFAPLFPSAVEGLQQLALQSRTHGLLPAAQPVLAP